MSVATALHPILKKDKVKNHLYAEIIIPAALPPIYWSR